MSIKDMMGEITEGMRQGFRDELAKQDEEDARERENDTYARLTMHYARGFLIGAVTTFRNHKIPECDMTKAVLGHALIVAGLNVLHTSGIYTRENVLKVIDGFAQDFEKGRTNAAR